MPELTLFQRILKEETPAYFIARGDSWGSFLDVFPRREGHTLVVPMEPCQYVSELSPNQLSELLEGLQETQRILSSYFKTQDFTILVHDGPLAGQEIPHVHFHVIPRTVGDGGRSLPALWPNAQISSEPDLISISKLHSKIVGE